MRQFKIILPQDITIVIPIRDTVEYGSYPDFAEVNENYNLFEASEELRKIVLEAAITYGNGFYKKKYKSLFADMTGFS